MIWLTWRQSRTESLIGGVALALVAAFLLWTGHTMISSYHDAGLPRCVAAHATDDGCLNAADGFFHRFDHLSGLTGWLNLLPFLLGLLLAAPTILDLEQGTHRLAWTQSVTRRRWLAIKIAYGLALAAVVSAGFVALMSWWQGPFDALQGRLHGNGFDFEGTVPFAYVVFSFAVCLAIGTVLRRAIPAVGIGLVVYLVARLGTIEKLRPNFLDPLRLTWDPLDPAPAAATNRFGFGDGSWVIGEGLTVGDDSKQALRDILSACGGATDPQSKAMVGSSAPDDAFSRCLHDHGVLNVITYHPANRFWTFQGIETALFLGVAAVLLAVAAWWMLRRTA